jgi:hypothetical protein
MKISVLYILSLMNTPQKTSTPNDFLKITPTLSINRSQILWVQKYQDCIYISQPNKTHTVCNIPNSDDVFYKQLDNDFFGKKTK